MHTDTQPTPCTQHSSVGRTTSPHEVDAVLELQNELEAEREVEKKLADRVSELKALVATLQTKVLQARSSHKQSVEESMYGEPTH